MNRNIEKKFKGLPEDVKFSTLNSENEDDILLEILIANLINNGSSFSSLMLPIKTLEKEKDKREMKEKITNIILDFLELNPQFVPILKKNDEVANFLQFFGLNI
ncbi:MAG: hypothetical protein JXQ93_03240 [Flavobacteriaceae bacterium]